MCECVNSVIAFEMPIISAFLLFSFDNKYSLWQRITALNITDYLSAVGSAGFRTLNLIIDELYNKRH